MAVSFRNPPATYLDLLSPCDARPACVPPVRPAYLMSLRDAGPKYKDSRLLQSQAKVPTTLKSLTVEGILLYEFI